MAGPSARLSKDNSITAGVNALLSDQGPNISYSAGASKRPAGKKGWLGMTAHRFKVRRRWMPKMMDASRKQKPTEKLARKVRVGSDAKRSGHSADAAKMRFRGWGTGREQIIGTHSRDNTTKPGLMKKTEVRKSPYRVR